MTFRWLLVAVLCAVPAWAQTQRLTVGQLKSFVISSVQMKHPDKKVAEYLKSVVLTQKLTTNDLDELMGAGIGPKTADALQALAGASAQLPSPPAEVKVRTAPPPPMPPPDAATQVSVIEEARQMALSYTKNLPNFICLQYTRRYYDPSGLEQFVLADRVAERLSYFEQREDYKVISVNGTPSEKKHDELGGATSSGEFGTMLKQLFEPETQARFQWERWAKLRGHIMHVYSYEVSKARSNWHISWHKEMEIVTAYRGLVYVDRDAHIVARLTLEATGMPPTFPIQEARTMLDYDFIEISGNPFLLPLRSEMRMRDGKMLMKNETEFRGYRKFGAEATITFDMANEPLPEDKLKEEPIKPKPVEPVKK